MIIQRYVDWYTGQWDFNVSGGAIGSYDLQIPIPANSLVEICFLAVVIPVSSALGMISFDSITTSVFPNVVVVGQYLQAVQAISGFNLDIPTFGLYWGQTTGFQPIYNNGISTSVGMSISGAPMTAGQIKVVARVVGFDF